MIKKLHPRTNELRKLSEAELNNVLHKLYSHPDIQNWVGVIVPALFQMNETEQFELETKRNSKYNGQVLKLTERISLTFDLLPCTYFEFCFLLLSSPYAYIYHLPSMVITPALFSSI